MSENVGVSVRDRTTNIVEQILEQGQRLRNAMVKSILDNDPFYVDVVDKNPFNNSSIQRSKHSQQYINHQRGASNNQKPNILNFEWDGVSPIDSPPTMSGEFSDLYCNCEICMAYGSHTVWASKNLPFRNLKREVIPLSNHHDRKLPEDIFKGNVDLPDFNRISENSTTKSSQETTAVQTQSDNFPEEITKSIQDNYRSKAAEYFKYVNSLKIVMNSLTLNQAGNRKVQASSVDSKYKLPASLNHSYFIEYSIPECLINASVQPKIHSKVDSGLSKNLYRICSKRLQNEEIYFKHSSIHDIVNLLQLNLQDVEIKFQVSCRTMKQKRSNIIGYVTFHMSSFEVTKNLCCNQEFPILSEDFVLGTLKMTLQLGCGRMYFGKEFVDFVNNNMKNSESVQTSGRNEFHSGEYNTLSSQQADSVIFVDNKISNVKNHSKAIAKKTVTTRLNENPNPAPPIRSLQQQTSYNGSMKTSAKPTSVEDSHKSSGYNYISIRRPSTKEASVNTSDQHTPLYDDKHRNIEYDYSSFRPQISKEESIKTPVKHASIDDRQEKSIGYDHSTLNTNSTAVHNVGVKENTNFIRYSQNTIHADVENKSLLYGLIYVSEARYFEGPINSYFSCQGFCQGVTLCSRTAYNSREPIFNFYQKVPFLLDEVFLLYMKNNSIIINFWEKYEEEEIAIGTSQLSLHQFFITYRNKAIADTLLQNRLPVTISDWWEPICSPVNGKIYGQMKVLVAIGTPAQIHNLEVERGLKDNSSSVTYVPIVSDVKDSKQEENMSSPNGYSIKRPNPLPNKNVNSDKIINNKRNAPLPTPVSDRSKQSENVHQIKNASIEETKKVKTVDIGVQSNVEMKTQIHTEPQNDNTRNNALETLISHLIEQKQRNIYVENGTSTEDLGGNSNTIQLNNEKLDNSVANSVSKLNHCKNTTNTQLRKTSDLLDYLNQALSVDNRLTHAQSSAEDENNFKAHIAVEGALHLPYKRKCRSRKTKRKGVSYEETLPTTYVTFETIPGADLQITSVVSKSASPQWDYRSDVLLPGDVLTNSQKRLIFKVWRKSNGNSPQPNLQTDTVLGFAALDLTVLLSGLPSVQGWFNIVDFSCKCNGQIKINITPLENISRFKEAKNVSTSQEAVASLENHIIRDQSPTFELKEEPSELLSRTLKRKFTELEEITQRLRLRLADVTKDDSDTSNDEFADEFERDINTLQVEDDYNMIDLGGGGKAQQSLLDMPNDYLFKQIQNEKPRVTTELANFSRDVILPKLAPSDSAYSSTRISDKTENISRPFATTSFNSISSNEMSESGSQIFQRNSPNPSSTPGHQQLKAGKQRIDQLLEKLTQLSAADTADNLFSNRYVSGCSVNQEIPTSSEMKPENNFNIDEILNPALFNRLCTVEVDPETNRTDFSDELESSSSNAQIDNDCSSSSLLTQFSTYRQAPDGAGYSVDSNIGISKRNI